MTCCCHENGQRKLGMVKTVQQDWYDITLRDVTCNDKQYAEMQKDRHVKYTARYQKHCVTGIATPAAIATTTAEKSEGPHAGWMPISFLVLPHLPLMLRTFHPFPSCLRKILPQIQLRGMGNYSDLPSVQRNTTVAKTRHTWSSRRPKLKGALPVGPIGSIWS